MKKYYSISQFPGNTGKYFYTKFFEYYNYQASYEPLGTECFKSTFDQIFENASGISVSMPFKKTCIDFLDYYNQDVENYLSCNTISIENKLKTGFNCDLMGVKHICNLFDSNNFVNILGSGCMGNMFYKYINSNVKLISRKLGNWDERHDSSDICINCTSLGTSISESPLNYIPNKLKLIVDLSLKKNDLQKLSIKNNIRYIPGIVFYKHQFLSQFEIYTHINPDPEYFDYLFMKMNN